MHCRSLSRRCRLPLSSAWSLPRREFRSGLAGPPRHHFGGAIQVTLFTLIGEGASVAAAVSAALIVGARHMLYSVTLAPKFQNQPGWFRWIGSYVLIDQVFVLSQIKPIDEPVAFRRYFLSAGFTFWTLWMTCTALGIVLGPRSRLNGASNLLRPFCLSA